jgi:hypothetical protein
MKAGAAAFKPAAAPAPRPAASTTGDGMPHISHPRAVGALSKLHVAHGHGFGTGAGGTGRGPSRPPSRPPRTWPWLAPFPPLAAPAPGFAPLIPGGGRRRGRVRVLRAGLCASSGPPRLFSPFPFSPRVPCQRTLGRDGPGPRRSSLPAVEGGRPRTRPEGAVDESGTGGYCWRWKMQCSPSFSPPPFTSPLSPSSPPAPPRPESGRPRRGPQQPPPPPPPNPSPQPRASTP